MQSKFELHPVNEYVGKDQTGGMRIYVGKLHVGSVYPDRRKYVEQTEEKFRFVSNFQHPVLGSPDRFLPLEEIKTHIELSLKEFLNTICK